MRRVIGYKNGRPVWSENVPANPGSSKLGGSLVVAESQATRERAVKARHREKMRAEKAS